MFVPQVRFLLPSVLVATMGLLAFPSLAQETSFAFNHSTPGARSLAMGGAFIGLADDATAAYTNPAGLTNLTIGGPEVAIELRNWEYSNGYRAGGRLSTAAPTQLGIDTTSDILWGESRSSTSGLSYLSMGYVLKGGITLALYRQELANSASAYEASGLFSSTCPGNLDQCLADTAKFCERNPEKCPQVRTPPSRVEQDLRIFNTGAAAAYMFSIPRRSGKIDSLSVGLGLSYYQPDLRSKQEDFHVKIFGDRNRDREPRGLFGPADFTPDNLEKTTLLKGQGSSVGFEVGLLWKSGVEGRWSLGAVYRQGPKIDVDAVIISGPSSLNPGKETEGRGTLHVPDVLGFGIAYAPRRGSTKVTFDYDRVGYSRRHQDYFPDRHDPLAGKLRVQDAEELHLGLEQVFLTVGADLVATLRLGSWCEPAHELEAAVGDPLYQKAFPAGEDQFHWTGGVGLVIREDFQIDAAFDYSERARIASISLVKFF